MAGVAVAVLVAALGVWCVPRLPTNPDECWYLLVVRRVRAGRRLYRGVFFGAGPWSVWVSRVVVRRWGERLLVLRRLVVVLAVTARSRRVGMGDRGGRAVAGRPGRGRRHHAALQRTVDRGQPLRPLVAARRARRAGRADRVGRPGGRRPGRRLGPGARPAEQVQPRPRRSARSPRRRHPGWRAHHGPDRDRRRRTARPGGVRRRRSRRRGPLDGAAHAAQQAHLREDCRLELLHRLASDARPAARPVGARVADLLGRLRAHRAERRPRPRRHRTGRRPRR